MKLSLCKRLLLESGEVTIQEYKGQVIVKFLILSGSGRAYANNRHCSPAVTAFKCGFWAWFYDRNTNVNVMGIYFLPSP